MVLVVIKSANGAVDDFRVNGAESSWTVAEVKNYLYRHYPTHPPVPSQKLIYRGQLLENSRQLSDILVPHSEEQAVIHLVAYERSASAPAVRTGVVHSSLRGSVSVSSQGERDEGEGEGERGEQVPNTTVLPDTSTGQGREPQSVAAAPADHTPHPWLRYRPHPQPMQWFPGAPLPPNAPVFPVGGAYPYPPFYVPPPYAGAGPAHPLQQWYHAYYARPGVVGGAEVGGGEGEEIDLPNLPDRQENADLEQDDLPVNAGAAGGMMLAGPQLQARRDLVDYGYMLLMATVLVSVAYLSSSFGRIFLFLAGVLFMFLNQAGFFSLQRRQRHVGGRGVDDLPDPLDRHRARQQGERGEGERGEGDQEGEGALPGAGERERVSREGTPNEAGSAPNPTSPPPPPPPPPPPTPPRPGILTVAFTFVTTLFTSLLPQQQPDL